MKRVVSVILLGLMLAPLGLMTGCCHEQEKVMQEYGGK